MSPQPESGIVAPQAMLENRDIAQHGFVIRDLPATLLDELEHLEPTLTQLPAKHWTRVIRSSTLTTDFAQDDPMSVAEHAQALSRMDSGELCYSFLRIRCEDGNLELPAVRRLTAFLLSDPMRAFIREHAGRTVHALSVYYVNRFCDGDFLTTHRDAGDNLALVINLTRNWHPVNGGVTFLLDQQNRIVQALNPQFGQALMFDCRENTVPHFVSSVTSPSGRHRSAIVARYA